MEVQFIDAVKRNECLWKTDSLDYKNYDVKEAAWRRIIEECDLAAIGINTVKDVKYYWKKLRDTHRQVLSRKWKSNKKWKNEDQMDFILPYIKKSRPLQDSEMNFIDYVDATDLTNDSDESPTQEFEIEVEEPVISFTEEKPSINSDSCFSIEEPERVLPTTESETSRSVALDSFFASMREMTDSLPEHYQIRIERKIFDIIMEAREDHLRSQFNINKMK